MNQYPKSSRNIFIFSQNSVKDNEQCVSILDNVLIDSRRSIVIMSQTAFTNNRSQCSCKPINIHGIPRHVLEETMSLKALTLNT